MQERIQIAADKFKMMQPIVKLSFGEKYEEGLELAKEMAISEYGEAFPIALVAMDNILRTLGAVGSIKKILASKQTGDEGHVAVLGILIQAVALTELWEERNGAGYHPDARV